MAAVGQNDDPPATANYSINTHDGCDLTGIKHKLLRNVMWPRGLKALICVPTTII